MVTPADAAGFYPPSLELVKEGETTQNSQEDYGQRVQVTGRTVAQVEGGALDRLIVLTQGKDSDDDQDERQCIHQGNGQFADRSGPGS